MFGIIFIRKLWNFTAEDVANKMGIHRTAVAGWERTKKVPFQRLDALSEMFDGLDKKYFSKDLTELDQLNIQHFKTMSGIRKEQLKYEENTPEEFQKEWKHFYNLTQEQTFGLNVDTFIHDFKNDIYTWKKHEDITEQEERLELYKAIFEAEKQGAIRGLLKNFLNAYRCSLNGNIPEDEYEMDLYFALYKKQKRDKAFNEMMGLLEMKGVDNEIEGNI